MLCDRALFATAVLWCVSSYICGAAAGEPSTRTASPSTPCIQIFHDQRAAQSDREPFFVLFLANLLGHWPEYEVRVRSLNAYRPGDFASCHATFYLGKAPETAIPGAFAKEFFKPGVRAAWIGYGIEQLNTEDMDRTFAHKFNAISSIQTSSDRTYSFFDTALYKTSVFLRQAPTGELNAYDAQMYDVGELIPSGVNAGERVLAKLMNSHTHKVVPYIVEGDNKFLIPDNPFNFMQGHDRYMIVADIIFDVLDEKPRHPHPIAFARVEDVHGFYELPLLSASLQSLRDEEIPLSIAVIPFFTDPLNASGRGRISPPVPIVDNAKLSTLLREVAAIPRNALLWHGVTHQYANKKNPHSGVSGEDYEFWDVSRNRPIEGESARGWLQYLEAGLPIFATYGVKPRYWITPHYRASAIANSIFGEVYPWIVGQSYYYSSSRGVEFVLPAIDIRTTISRQAAAKRFDMLVTSESDNDRRSEQGMQQLFPYEIYRDIYGQRIVPETLGYIEITPEKTGWQLKSELSTDAMLANAKRNSIIRDYWASFFFHPFIFANKSRGGLGRHDGDTTELKKLVIGLKRLGYTFVGLPEFEHMVAGWSHEKEAAVSLPSTSNQRALP